MIPPLNTPIYFGRCNNPMMSFLYFFTFKSIYPMYLSIFLFTSRREESKQCIKGSFGEWLRSHRHIRVNTYASGYCWLFVCENNNDTLRFRYFFTTSYSIPFKWFFTFLIHCKSERFLANHFPRFFNTRTLSRCAFVALPDFY